MAAYCIKCGHPYSEYRKYALKYLTCTDCGSPPLNLPVVPVNKSNYVVGTMSELAEGYGHKGPRV